MQKLTDFGYPKLQMPGIKRWQHLNIRFIMRVSAVLILSMTLSAQLLIAGAGYSQTMEEKEISIELKNVSLKNALNKIEKNSGFKIAYILEQVSRYKDVSISGNKRSVASVLKLILSGTMLDFRQDNNTILIYPNPKMSAIASTEQSQGEEAKNKTISGKVTNSEGVAISGVSIYVQSNPSIGTVTDANGMFRIDVPDNTTVLVFSSVGMEKQIVSIDGRSEINISLKTAVLQQEEVVVVGYGSQKKKDLTGSISSVTKDHMNLGGTTANIGQALQGRAAGVRVQQSDFSPGGAISIVVRGGNSINTTNEPLYVVDGFISDNGKLINPNDIEDIQVLKDASATAIYGARAGNGVVLITTKKGETGKMQITGDASNGQQYVTYKPSLLTGQQYVDIQNATAAEEGKPPVFPSSFPVANTNWWDETTQQSSVLNRSVSLSGNDRTSKLYISGNYFKQNGVLRKTSMERYTARIGAEKKFSDNVKIGANFYGANNDYQLLRYNSDITAPLYSIYLAPPAIPVYNSDGSYYRYLGRDNPLAGILEPTNVSTNKLINGNMFGDYEIIKNLTYHLSGGSEFSQTRAGQYTPTTLASGLANRGIAQEQMSTSFRWLVEQYLTYKYTKGFHSATALIGTSNQKDVSEFLYAGSSNYSTDIFLFYNLAGGTRPVQGATLPASGKLETKLTSYYGRLNYTYRDRILATFTLRDDASSRFGPNNRHGLFPSGALAWRISEEDFMERNTIFSNLKLRVSYGITGNDRIGDYAFLTRFSSYSTVLAPGASLSAGIEPASLSNNNLKWESTTQTDIGIDMGFLKGRVNATIDLYKKKTTDLLLSVPVGQWWGFATQTTNAGSVENKGIELSITSDNIKNRDLLWSTTFNIAYNKQKALSLANSIKFISTNTANPSGVVSGREFTRLEPGKELGVLFGYQYAGVIKSGETYAPQPLSKPGDPKYVDYNNDGAITPADATYMGHTNPRYIAGLGNDFQYKGISLNVFFQGAFDYNLYNMNRLVLESTTSTDALNRWVASKNESTDIPRAGYFQSIYGSYVNSRFVENASYIRLKMVSLGYNIPVQLIKQIKFIDELKIYATGQNLATFTKYTGTDPETNTHAGSNLGGGIDFNGFPAYRIFTFGLKLTIH